MSLNDSNYDSSRMPDSIGYWQAVTHDEHWVMPPTETNFPMSRVNQIYLLEWSLISGHPGYDWQNPNYILGADLIKKTPIDMDYGGAMQDTVDLINNIRGS